MNIPISVIVLTYNSARYIESCLTSVLAFEEVVVYDNGSVDETVAIVSRFANAKLIQGPFIGFGPMRRLATRQARHDWVLALDSDELLTPNLVEEIKSLKLDPHTVYAVSRINHYRGVAVHCCGWYPDFVVRLFNRDVAGYSERLVHESVLLPVGGVVQKLRGHINHYPFEGVTDLIDKMQKYSSLYAQQHAHTRGTSTLVAALKAWVAFIKNYFFQRGVLEGSAGFLISVSNATGVFYKYMKLREINMSDCPGIGQLPTLKSEKQET
ncbi:MAG: glycosyltransferase family 2 protein [Magnetococcales bacterium]|nr:glycosyltransferase family 2 protein [Magnetococcales bacterium]